MVLPYLECGLVLDHSRDFHRLDCRSSEYSFRVLGRRSVASFLAVRSEVILGPSVGLTERCSQPLADVKSATYGEIALGSYGEGPAFLLKCLRHLVIYPALDGPVRCFCISSALSVA